MVQNQLTLMVLTLPGLTFLILPDQSFETNQANPGLDSLILNLKKLILADQLLSPPFSPEKSSTRHCSKKKLDVFIFLKSLSLKSRIRPNFE